VKEDNRLSYFFLGLGLGVAAGILLAPKSGTETRELIKTKAGEGTDFLKKRSSDLKDSANELVDRGRSLLDQLSQAVEAGKQAYREAVGSTADPGPAGDGI
jgi:gas vesicle protein